MSLGEVVFWAMVAIVTLGALGAVLSNSLVYAIFFLLLTMGGVAGLYVYLGTPFLAMMQILIYIGAIGVLMVFAVMLAGPFWLKPKERGAFFKVGAGVVLIVVILLTLGRALQEMPSVTGGPLPSSAKEVGDLIMGRYSLAFELLSLLIAISIVGALMLGLLSRREGS